MTFLVVGVSALPAAAGTQGDGLLVQNESVYPVYITAGGLGNASCVNNWGGVSGLGSNATLTQGQNNSTNNPITVEFTQTTSCGNSSSWLFPFTVNVGSNQVPENMIELDGTNYGEGWCTTTAAEENANSGAGEVGATNMGCYENYIGNAAEITAMEWLAPDPLVVYGSGYDVIFSAVEPAGKNQTPNGCTNGAGWHYCLGVQVVPEGTAIGTPVSYRTPHSAGANGTLTVAQNSIPLRQDVFTSVPRSGRLAASMDKGRLTLRVPLMLGGDAQQLVARVGSAHIANWVSLSVSGGAGDQSFSVNGTHALGNGTLSNKARNRTQTISLSRALTSRICSAAGGLGQITVDGKQLIGEPGHTYETNFSKRVSLATCPHA
jgi:hypothetical protein